MTLNIQYLKCILACKWKVTQKRVKTHLNNYVQTDRSVFQFSWPTNEIWRRNVSKLIWYHCGQSVNDTNALILTQKLELKFFEKLFKLKNSNRRFWFFFWILKTQELKNSKTQKLKNSRTQELENSRTQELKNSKIQSENLKFFGILKTQELKLKNLKTQELENSRTQKLKNSKTQELKNSNWKFWFFFLNFKNSRTRKLKNSKTQKLKNSKTQKLKNSKTQKLKNSKIQKIKNSKTWIENFDFFF